MCGIAGIIHDGGKSYHPNIKAMNYVQRHRGPDDTGVTEHKRAILGHTRLSVVGILFGHQPMTCGAGDVSITFNGEIYGYKNIKKELDYNFCTDSDTEVILALYKQYGLDMFQKLNGMFAFAIWDERKRSLLLARDRFGEKPLYYAFGEDGEFVFASEIKAIIESNLIKPIISKKAIAHYLQYLYIDPQETVYENIYTIPPASYLCFIDGKLTITRYYDYPTTNIITVDDAVGKFRLKLDRAVENQLIADVDVGAFLSGGLDSSTIVAIAKKYKNNLKTFSFGFKGSRSELPYAQEIAKKYGTDHYELVADDIDIAELMITMADVYDEPFADSSNIPTYLISKLAREYSKVILTGDGADELLGGYGWWYDPLLGIGNRDSYLKLVLFKMLAKSFAKSYQLKANRIKYGRKYKSITDAHKNRSTFFSDGEISDLISINMGYEKSYIHKEENTINDALNMDLQEYMAGDILVKTDRASMANSLELRSPYLDADFATFCISLPANLKITGQSDKLILRKAYQESWTESIRSRDKQGFGAPVNSWLKHKSVVELKDIYFNRDSHMFTYVSFDKAQKYFYLDNYQTWILLVLSIWFEKNAERVR